MAVAESKSVLMTGSSLEGVGTGTTVLRAEKMHVEQKGRWQARTTYGRNSIMADYRNEQTCRSRLGLTGDRFLLTGPGRARIDLDHFGDPPLSAIILCPDPQGCSTRDPHIASRLQHRHV